MLDNIWYSRFIIFTSEGSIVEDNTEDEDTIKDSQRDEELVEGVSHDVWGENHAGDGIQDQTTETHSRLMAHQKITPDDFETGKKSPLTRINWNY